MKERLQSIREEAIRQIEASDVPEKLNEARVRFLGKKGELTAVLKGMKDVAPEDRPAIGQMVNEIQNEYGTLICSEMSQPFGDFDSKPRKKNCMEIIAYCARLTCKYAEK